MWELRKKQFGKERDLSAFEIGEARDRNGKQGSGQFVMVRREQQKSWD